MIGSDTGKCPAVIIKELHSKSPTSTQQRPVRKMHTLVGLTCFGLAGALSHDSYTEMPPFTCRSLCKPSSPCSVLLEAVLRS